MSLLYDYQLITHQLVAMGAISSAAELQGLLCGQLAGGWEADDAAWLDAARGFMDLEHFDATAEQQELVLFLRDETRSRLQRDDFGFAPLLPEDACPLTDKARELGAWCRGFLHGFGSSGIDRDSPLGEEVTEVIRDFARISQAVSAVEDEEDETENDWYELVEYLKAGVYTVYTEMNAPDASDSPSTLH